jgi:hypothetical protein
MEYDGGTLFIRGCSLYENADQHSIIKQQKRVFLILFLILILIFIFTNVFIIYLILYYTYIYTTIIFLTL